MVSGLQSRGQEPQHVCTVFCAWQVNFSGLKFFFLFQ